MNVLFVCTGNVCRSPMAEAFLRHEAEHRGLGLSVRSTGTHAWHGRAATFDGRRIMTELGVPMDDHRTLELDSELVDWADLIIGMATEHVRDTRRAFPEAAERTFTLKGFCELLPTLPTYEDTGSWLEAAASMRDRADAIDDPDVDDPFGERRKAYQRVATEIQGLIETMAAGLEDKQVALRA